MLDRLDETLRTVVENLGEEFPGVGVDFIQQLARDAAEHARGLPDPYEIFEITRSKLQRIGLDFVPDASPEEK